MTIIVYTFQLLYKFNESRLINNFKTLVYNLISSFMTSSIERYYFNILIILVGGRKYLYYGSNYLIY